MVGNCGEFCIFDPKIEIVSIYAIYWKHISEE
jgi:hypothetical protein